MKIGLFDLSVINSNYEFYSWVIEGRMFKSQAYEAGFPDTLVRWALGRKALVIYTILHRGKEYSFPASPRVACDDFNYKACQYYIDENIKKVAVEVGWLVPLSEDEQIEENFRDAVPVDRRKVKKIKRKRLLNKINRKKLEPDEGLKFISINKWGKVTSKGMKV
jgi:hypothetical protein